MQILRFYVHPSVCSVMNCTIMYYEQTAGPRSTNFSVRMHVSNYFHLPITFQIVNILNFHFQD